MDNSRLAHSKWNCKYHIVFVIKYRRKIIYENHKYKNIMFKKVNRQLY